MEAQNIFSLKAQKQYHATLFVLTVLVSFSESNSQLNHTIWNIKKELAAAFDIY